VEIKKSPDHLNDPGIPYIPRISAGLLFHGSARTSFQAGLLTPGSAIFSPLPGNNFQWINVINVPGYSGGPVLESHEIPFLSLYSRHLKLGRVINKWKFILSTFFIKNNSAFN